jgi:acyl-CoA synthetase (NDP forming)
MSAGTVESTAGLRALLEPGGVVVIGASNRESNLGLRFTQGLQRHSYAGPVSVVNRRAEPVDGIPGYQSLEQVPGTVDLAVIAVNAGAVAEAIDACGARGVRAAIVFTSGFGEVGGEGMIRQREIAARARAAGVRLMGPNCVGFVNVPKRVCVIASGFAFRSELLAGSLSVITQSGGVAGLIGERAQDVGIGLSHVISTGNEADVTAGELVDYLVAEGSTRSLALYLEAVREPQRLGEALSRARTAGIGVAIFKAGAGERTAAAAAAHTGSVVGDDAGFDAFCRQVGAVRVHDLDHLFLVAPVIAALDTAGSRVGVLSISGGAAVAVADACERCGLELPPLSEATQEGVGEMVPGFASRQNPVDISGTFVVDMPQFQRSLEILTGAPEFDAVVLVQTVHPEQLADRVAEVIIVGADPTRTSIMWAAGDQTRAARRRLREAGFGVSESPTACAVAVAAATASRQLEPPALRWPKPGGTSPERASEALALLAAHGVPVAPMEVVTTAAEASAAAERMGFPVVAKADLRSLAHKSEHGGVKLGLRDGRAVQAAFAELDARGQAGDGVLVQKAVLGSRELLVTAVVDPVFGLALAVGFGGVLTEAIGRGALLLPPLTPSGLAAALDSAGLTRLVGSFRGTAAIDLGQLLALGRGLLEAAAQLGGLRHLELNPVIVGDDGSVCAVDALIDTNVEMRSDAPGG